MPAYPYQLLLKHLLHQGVTWAPEQEIVYRNQARQTYRHLERRVLQLAGALTALGVETGTRIGVIEWDSHRYLEMYFAIPGSGAVLHTINPRLAPQDLLYTITHAEDQILIFHEDFLPLVDRLRDSAPTIRRFIIICDKPDTAIPTWVDAEYEAFINRSAPLPALPDLDENTLATLSYTTGTTGMPKGVYFTHRQITLQSLSDAVALSALGNHGGVNKYTHYMPLTPMFHGHAWGMPYVATMLGLKQVYAGKYEIPLLLHLIQAEKITFSHCVPTILQAIIRSPLAKDIDLSNWHVLVGGAALSKSLAAEAAAQGVRLSVGYGLSETCPILAISDLKPFMDGWDAGRQLDQVIKSGFTFPLVYLKVVNAAGKEIAPNDKETGEVLARSPWCTPAYYKEDVLSRELWAGGWLHTGDLATIDEYGYIQIVDRLKDVIRSGGEWIVSIEVEKLLDQHEGVLEAAVIGVPDEKWGERPLAIITPEPDYQGQLTDETLHAHLKKYVETGILTPWSTPDRYIFVSEIPKTSVGKFNKKLLRSQYAAAQHHA